MKYKNLKHALNHGLKIIRIRYFLELNEWLIVVGKKRYDYQNEVDFWLKELPKYLTNEDFLKTKIDDYDDIDKYEFSNIKISY